jgi:hypothetical protein
MRARAESGADTPVRAFFRIPMRARAKAAIFISIFASLFMIYLPAWLPSRCFAGMDFVNLLYPQAALVKGAYAAGKFPLWNWFTWDGSPLLAAMQSAPLYPPMWVALLFPIPFALQTYVLIHLAWGGLGTACLCRLLFKTDVAGCILAGISYAGGSFLFGHLEQINSIAAMSWAPWILFTAVQAAIVERSVILFSACVSMGLLAGHPQHIVLSVIFAEILAGLLLIFWPYQSELKTQKHRRIVRFVILQFGLAIAFGICSAQLLPARELGSYSERVWPYPDPDQPALKLSYLPSIILPHFYNRLANTDGQPLGYTELGLYSGLITLPLALCGLISGFCKRSSSRAPLCAAGILVIALLYSLGNKAFVSSLFYKLIPFLGQSRGAARSLNVFAVLYCCFAGFGLQRVIARVRSQRLKCGFAICAVAILLADLTLAHHRELTLRIIPSGILSDVKPIAVAKLSKSGPNRVYRMFVSDSDLHLDNSPGAVARRIQRLQPNLNILSNTATVDGYEEGLLPQRQLANFLRKFNRNLRNDTLDASLLRLLGVTTVICEFPQVATPDYPLTANSNDIIIHKTDHATAWLLNAKNLPLTNSNLQVYSASRRDVTHGDASLNHGYIFEDTQRNGAIAHPMNSVSADQFSQAIADAQIHDLAIDPNSITFACSLQQNAPMLFLQSSYPGWVLKRGSSVISLSRVAPVFSRFDWHVDTGQSNTAVLAFEPYSFRIGLFISLATLIIVFSSKLSRIVQSMLDGKPIRLRN